MLWSVLLIGYAFLLHLGLFLAPEAWQPEHAGTLSQWVYGKTGFTGPLPDVLAVLLLALQGALVNAISLRHRVTEALNLFPGLFYVLVASLLPEFLHLTPQLLANTFFLIALSDLLAVYNRPRSSGYIFNVGLWIGLASLFFFPYLFLFLWAFIGLNILRAYDIRERLMVISGILVPYVLVGLYFYLHHDTGAFVEAQWGGNFGFFDFEPIAWSWTTAGKLLLFGVPLLVVLLRHGSFLSKRVIQEQKQIDILYWAMLLAGLTVFLQTGPDLAHLLMLAPPLGFLLAIHFGRLKGNWAEFYHFVLLIGALFLQLKSVISL